MDKKPSGYVPADEKFEYSMMEVPLGANHAEPLSMAGAEGWEAVSISRSSTGDVQILLKRRLVPEGSPDAAKKSALVTP